MVLQKLIQFWQCCLAIICYFEWMGAIPLLQHLFPIMERCSSWGQTCESGCLILFSSPDPAFVPPHPGNVTPRYFTLRCSRKWLCYSLLDIHKLFSFPPRCKRYFTSGLGSKCTATIWLSQPLFCLYKWANSAHIIQLIYCCLNPRIRSWKSKLIPSIPRWFSKYFLQ